MYKFLVTSDNEKVYYDDILYYMQMKRYVKNRIMKSPRFVYDAEHQNFEMYNKVMEGLRLRTPDGKILQDYEVMELYNDGEIGKKNSNLTK